MKRIYKRKEDMVEDYNKVSGMLSDQDIRHYWKKGIYVYDTEKKFDLGKR